jgi:hypothetical protein
VNGVSPPAELAQVLSPSQVRCFMDCQARWWFKHSLRYPDPPRWYQMVVQDREIALPLLEVLCVLSDT